jgi:hypothetical protein
MIPSVSMSYSPDFASDRFGYYQNVQIDSLGIREDFRSMKDSCTEHPLQGKAQLPHFPF